jgi:hypothetical protein
MYYSYVRLLFQIHFDAVNIQIEPSRLACDVCHAVLVATTDLYVQ